MMHLQIENYQAAHDEGRAARLAGEPFLLNPYLKVSENLRDAWSEGWMDEDKELRGGS